MKIRDLISVKMDLTVKHEAALHAQGFSPTARKMSLNFSASQGEAGGATESSPTYTTNDAFPYGLSGVAMPNYGYPGDLYQFTSNGYPRKSRTCCYCGKVFTRSTTRRYHEKRCPLLRAAVCGIVPDNGKRSNGPSGPLPHNMTSVQSIDRKSWPPTSSAVSGINPHTPHHHIPTSRITSSSPPALMMKRSSEDQAQNGLGYQTSVIVKQELQDHLLKHQEDGKLAADLDYTGTMKQLTPDSNGSSPWPSKGAGDMGAYSPSPYHIQNGLDLSKSPSRASPKDDTKSEDGCDRDEFKQNGSDVDDIPDAKSFQERIKDDEARANDLNFTSPTCVDGSSLLLESTSPNMPHQTELEPISDAEDSKTEMAEGDKLNGPYADGDTNCAVCGKHFASSWQLHVHEQIHKKFKPYACRYCGLRFSKAALRITHEKLHMSETNLICAVCGETFNCRETLLVHVTGSHRDGPWLCRHCGKAAMTHQEVLEHLQTHEVAKEEMLSLQFFLQGPMPRNNDNAEEDANENELVNDMNDTELFNDSENLNDNEFISDSNDNDNSLASPETGEEMGVDGVTPSKQTEVLNSQDKEMCTICGRDFPKSHMPYHLKAHEGQKPYECPICGKRFGYKNNMKSHIKLHAGIKPYQCNVCGAKFTRGSTLRRHARRHGISAESVWDLFVRNGNSSQQQTPHNASSQHVLPSRNASEIASPSSPGLTSSKDIPMSENPGYSNLFYTATSAAMSNALLMSYHNHQAAAAAAANLPSLFSPLQSTSNVPPHSAGFVGSSQSPQSNALNLTLKSMESLPHTEFNHSGNNCTDCISPTSIERSRSRSLSGSDTPRPLHNSVPNVTGSNDVGIQVKTCCKLNVDSLFPGLGSPSDASVQSGDSGAIYQQGQNSEFDYSNETISTLLNSGRLFKCDHCECYFSEYAMYRIHSKIHTRGRTMPFVCPVCSEDCHDRVYFSLHLSEHLR